MLFMTYRPKTSKNVRAEQVTLKNIDEIATSFNGSAKVLRDKIDDNPNNDVVVLKIATLDGILEASIGNWVVRTGEGIELWGDPEFNEMYERARVRGED